MHLLTTCLAFVGDWFLFIYPVYQAGLELQDYRKFLANYREISINVKKISPLWWLIPPYKIWLEKKRGTTILRQAVHDENEFHEAMNFLNKATAWWYVALAGLLNSIQSSYELWELFEIKLNWIFFWLLILLLFFSGIMQVLYRLSDWRFQHMLHIFHAKK